MRKAMILALLVPILCLGGVCYAAATINQNRDQVVIEEEILYGDKACAEGLTALVHTTLDYHLFWDTTYVLGEVPVTQTEYRFSAKEEPPDYDWGHHGVQFDTFTGMTYFYREVDLETATDLEGMALAYQELAKETGTGQENSRVIRIADYYDHYPISLEIDLEGFNVWALNRYTGDRYSSELSQERLEKVIGRFEELFPIPVLEKEMVEISLGKNSNGLIQHMGRGSAGEDRYDMQGYSVVTEDACYFTVNNYSYEGTHMDLSQMKEGFGIYRLPYEVTERREVKNGEEYVVRSDIREEEMGNVYPIDEEAYVRRLMVSEDQQRLLLLTYEEELVLTVISLPDMKTIQRLELGEASENGYVWDVFLEEDFLVLRLDGGPLVMLTMEPDGSYVHQFTIPEVADENLALSVTSDTTALDWNGEKLAALTYGYRYYGDGNPSGFQVAVYDKSGMLFAGKYTSSLDTGDYYNRSYSDGCRLIDWEALEVSWGA